MLLSPQDAAFVFVDVQGRLADAMDDRELLFRNLRRLLAGLKLLDVPMLVTEQNPDKLGPTREEFADLLDGVPVLAKMAFSCCGDDAFMEALDELERPAVILAGIEAHVCVYQTAMQLMLDDDEYEVYVVADAVSSRTARNRELALRRLEIWGANLVSTEMLLMELLREAGTPAFREILKLIR